MLKYKTISWLCLGEILKSLMVIKSGLKVQAMHNTLIFKWYSFSIIKCCIIISIYVNLFDGEYLRHDYEIWRAIEGNKSSQIELNDADFSF